MRWLLTSLGIVGCTASGTGTVVYSEGNSAHIMTVDVASGAQTTLDLGTFGDVAIAPDRQHVVYLGGDGIPKLSDLEGNVTPLRSTGGCNGPFAWTGNTLTYCIVDPGGMSSVAFMPAIGAAVRPIATVGALAIANDGARIAYVRRNDTMSSGDLVVEAAAGGEQMTLIANTQIANFAFLPDGSGLIVTDVLVQNQSTLHLARLDFADGKRTDLGAGFLPGVVRHGSRFSPDGREVLAVVDGALVAVDVASGVTRRFSTLDARLSAPLVAFLGADRVLTSRIDAGESVQISDGTKDIVIVASDGSNQCSVADVDLAAGLIAVECAIPAILDFDGKLVTSRKSSVALGLCADGGGMVSLNQTGSIELVGLDGSVKPLAVALTPDLGAPISLVGPFAAYAP